MRVGEIWILAKELTPSPYDGKRWIGDCWLLPKVMIESIDGEKISFTDVNGEYQMEAMNGCPRQMFVKYYTKDYSIDNG